MNEKVNEIENMNKFYKINKISKNEQQSRNEWKNFMKKWTKIFYEKMNENILWKKNIIKKKIHF